jgi:voltage-gated potassium channel
LQRDVGRDAVRELADQVVASVPTPSAPVGRGDVDGLIEGRNVPGEPADDRALECRISDEVDQAARRHRRPLCPTGGELVRHFMIQMRGLGVWSSAETRLQEPWRTRGRFVLSPIAVVDLLAILPFYLAFVTGIDLRTLRVLRLLRILKLSRYSASIELLLDALRQEAHAIGAALFVLSLMLIVAASLAHLAEQQAQPEVFGTIPHALWWAVVTMTTVGYGDAVPVTAAGKVIGGLIGILGIGMVALPAGLLASGFSEQLHLRRRTFESEAEKMLADGIISAEEGDRLEELRERIGLTDHQAAEILRIARERRKRLVCPHCRRPIHAPPTASRGAAASGGRDAG